MLIIKNHEEFASHLNREGIVSGWHRITQEQVNCFATATFDNQWIHVDVERAGKESPFKATIVQGYLTLSLMPFFWQQMVELQNISMQVNYGVEHLKFGHPVLVDSEVRCRGSLKAISDIRGITKATFSIILEIKDQAKPAFTADVIFLCHFIR